MKVIFNSKEIEVPEDAVLYDYLMKIGYRRVMVTLNGEQLPAWKFKTTVLSEGDEITAKRISGGG